MRLQAVMILVAGCLLAADKKPKDDVGKKEQKLLAGTWQVVAMEEGGTKASARAVRHLQFIFRGNKVIKRKGDTVLREYTYTLNPSRKPKTIDVEVSVGESKGSKALGIYSLEKDTLTICMDNRGEKRPEKFVTAKAGNNVGLLVLKRQKE